MPNYTCRVYLDEAKQKRWPTDFVTCPRVGDYVTSEDGFKLKVLNIIHCTRRHPLEGTRIPHIEVELGR
jgi:hypothetical protein